jgi:hypothetical protein
MKPDAGFPTHERATPSTRPSCAGVASVWSNGVQYLLLHFCRRWHWLQVTYCCNGCRQVELGLAGHQGLQPAANAKGLSATFMGHLIQECSRTVKDRALT